MTFDILQKIIKENNIPSNVHLTSDSGWECDATEMNGVYKAYIKMSPKTRKSVEAILEKMKEKLSESNSKGENL